MSLSVCSLASGSTGNCFLAVDGGEAVLIDCGLSLKRLLAGLSGLGIPKESVRGIVLTHEHRDHCGGVGVVSRGLGIPVYTTAGTLAACSHVVKELAGQVIVDERTPFSVGSFLVEPFPTFHDAANPFALVLRPAQNKSQGLGVVTDLGFVSNLAFDRLNGVRTAVFESNHDKVMLMTGPYPWDLKQRIAGRQGHLDNVDCARALVKLWETGLRQVLLAHLSETNNAPEVVSETLSKELPENVRDSCRFIITGPQQATEIVEV